MMTGLGMECVVALVLIKEVNMWRPDDWGNRWQQAVDKNIEYIRQGNPSGVMFEAGADALLTALFKLAEGSPTKTFTIDSRVIGVYEEKTLGNVLIAMADIPKRVKEIKDG